MLLKHSHLITIVLLLTTKLMLFSTVIDNSIIYLIAITSSLLIILFNHEKKIIKTNNFIGLVLLILSTIIFSFSKINNDVSLLNFITPINLITILMAYISISYKPLVMKKSLIAYSNIMSCIILTGLFFYIALSLNIISPTEIVHASDHADERGYFSFHGLVYYPSWISINVFGLTFYRFTSVFWEPGTLGLYLVFLISIELINNDTKLRKYKIGIYTISGLLSLSLVFIFCIITLVLFRFLSRHISRNISKKKFIFRTILIFLVIAVFFTSYDLLHQLILYRLDFDANRGFVGNNRSGTFTSFLSQFSDGNILQQLFGFGPYAKFDGDTTSIFLKLYQRGILGFTLFFTSICFFAANTNNKYLYLSWIVGLLALTQIEGAIFFIMMMIIQINKKQSENINT